MFTQPRKLLSRKEIRDEKKTHTPSRPRGKMESQGQRAEVVCLFVFEQGEQRMASRPLIVLCFLHGWSHKQPLQPSSRLMFFAHSFYSPSFFEALFFSFIRPRDRQRVSSPAQYSTVLNSVPGVDKPLQLRYLVPLKIY